MTEKMPAQWALDKAAKLSGWASWADAAKHASENEKTAVIAHALTLEKYERPPEDPDILAVREILASLYETEGDGKVDPYDHNAKECRAGEHDRNADFLAALAAYKREKEK